MFQRYWAAFQLGNSAGQKQHGQKEVQYLYHVASVKFYYIVKSMESVWAK